MVKHTLKKFGNRWIYRGVHIQRIGKRAGYQTVHGKTITSNTLNHMKTEIDHHLDKKENADV